jgi:HAD superfamily hydrolase (TIGR01549 family)
VVASVTDELFGLEELLGGVRCVLFDFDGPICRLFAAHRADGIAARLSGRLAERGVQGPLTGEEQASGDPHVLLRAVGRMHSGSDLMADLEEWLTVEEILATASARPTAYADALIRSWTARGVRLAVTTNNSPRAVADYLARRGLADCFGAHIHGRTIRPELLKPNPDCLHRALDSTATRPSDALMIGDTTTDLLAANEAGVPFLGYARDEARMEGLYEAGAKTVVGSLEPVLDAVRRIDPR